MTKKKMKKKTIIPPLNAPHTVQIIEAFIKTRVSEAGAEGVVIGISGGIDSAVVATLAVRSLGSEKVLALFLPSNSTPPNDLDDVKGLCIQLGIKLTIVDIQKIVDVFSISLDQKEKISSLEWMNLKPRIRQSYWYFFANKLNYLVCGTGNKSELMIGYYTKYGDGAVDILPIGDVYKTHVYQLGEYLKIPKKIQNKIPSAGLTVGQTDENEIGMSYNQLDRILLGLERFQSNEEVANQIGIPLSDVKKVQAMIYQSEHKRRGPIIFKLGVRTPKYDWRIPLVKPSDF
ncbi:MAG: NAD+ synthase [Candidatus Hermodarchaeota archaeon]